MSALSPERLAEIRPRVVCLCGSTRFWRSFMEWYGRLTDEGCIVLTIGRIVGQSEGQLGETRKVALDELHLRKIDLADEVFVLDVGGYTGTSTKREIAHAEATGKPVRYLSREFPEYVEPNEPEFMRAMRQKDAEIDRLRAPAGGDEETAREIVAVEPSCETLPKSEREARPWCVRVFRFDVGRHIEHCLLSLIALLVHPGKR